MKKSINFNQPINNITEREIKQTLNLNLDKEEKQLLAKVLEKRKQYIRQNNQPTPNAVIMNYEDASVFIHIIIKLGNVEENTMYGLKLYEADLPQGEINVGYLS